MGSAEAMEEMLSKQSEHVAKLQQFVRSHIEFYQASAQVLIKLAEDLETKQSNPSVKQRATAAVASVKAGVGAGLASMKAKVAEVAPVPAPVADDGNKTATVL